jgi:hypothetical protein
MSLSHEFASFVAGLRYEDLPPEVVDRAKGVTLQALTSALIGEALVNWFETEYPSPLFPTPGSDGRPQVGSTQYFTAWGAVKRGYPLLRGAAPSPGESDPPEVLELMQRVTLIPVVRRTLFGPRVTIFTRDGRSFTKEGTGREFIWDFEEQARRIGSIGSAVGIGDAPFVRLVDACRRLEALDGPAHTLISLTIPQ